MNYAELIETTNLSLVTSAVAVACGSIKYLISSVVLWLNGIFEAGNIYKPRPPKETVSTAGTKTTSTSVFQTPTIVLKMRQ